MSARSALANLRKWLQGILTVPEIPLATGESRRRTPEQSRSHLGAKAEEAALRHLRAKGLRLMCRNRANVCGELDLVMERGETVVFVEVRARTVGSAVSSRDAVGPKKLAKVRRTAELFLRQHRLEKRKVRLDVVAVEMSHEGAVASLEHFEAVA
jgi:putative endonuclease